MKKTFKAQIASTIIALVAIIGIGMAGCSQSADDDNPNGKSGNPKTPVATDFNIGSLEVDYDGDPKPVTITAKASKSTGGITVWYAGISPTVYAKSKTAPSAIGKYAVTFDVAKTKSFEAVTLSAGTLTIKDNITEPHLRVDFEDDVWNNSSYNQRTVAWGGFGWTVSGVVIATDENDRKEETKSIRLRGNEGDNCRIELDSYLAEIKSISFNYASYSTHANGTIVLYYQVKGGAWVKAGEVTAEAWNGTMAKKDFTIDKEDVRFKIVREGDLANFTSVNIDNIAVIGDSEGFSTIDPVDPVADDFNINGLFAIANGKPHTVTITPKAGKSAGAIKVYYDGSTTAPSAAGEYAITFDVAAANGFNAVTGLIAGTLVIEDLGPNKLVDFEDSEAWNTGSYGAVNVTWGGYTWTVRGVTNPDDNDRHEGEKSLRLRSNASDTVENGIELVSYLNGIKSIEFLYGSYSSHSGGTIELYTQVTGGEWTKVGDTVTADPWSGAMQEAKFDVNKTNVRFKIVKPLATGSTSVNIDDIVIIANAESDLNVVPVAPVASDFVISGLNAIADGSPKAVSITPKAGMSAGAITILYNGSTTVPSAAGSYTVTFNVAAAGNFTAASGLSAGTLVIEAVTDDYFTINFEDSKWNGTGYAARANISDGGHTWTIVAVSSTTDANDRREGTRSARFRGSTSQSADVSDPNRVEMTDYMTSGIKKITFKYGSYSSHSGGVVVLYTQTNGSSTWTEAGRVTAAAWDGTMKDASFNVNATGSVRFKIEKVNASGSTSVCIDDIVVTY